jgi:hypothetical protein
VIKPAAGPESTYSGHALKREHVPSPEGAGTQEIKEQALGEHWSGVPSPTGLYPLPKCLSVLLRTPGARAPLHYCMVGRAIAWRL